MANVKISDLTAAAQVESDFLLEVENPGNPDTSEQATAQQVKDFVNAIEKGVHQIGYWPARALVPALTDGMAPLAQKESSSNNVNDEYLAADSASTTYATFAFRAPKSSDETKSFDLEIEWSEASGASSHDVTWAVEAQVQGEGDNIDSSWGTSVEVLDTGSSGTRRFVMLTNITPGGTWAEGDKILFRVIRAGGVPVDTLDVDAHLHGVTLFATISGVNDA